jgi:plastocyanin
MKPALLALVVAAAAAFAGPAASALVDPRAGGFEVALGEWSVAPEARAIRPGPVTFVVRNQGKLVHAFRIRSAGESGGDRFEVRTDELRPGQTARVSVRLAAGAYELECPVEDRHGDHEERGMDTRLTVSANAPLVRPGRASGPGVAIQGFAFRPAALRVTPGTTVRWTNRDDAPHTVTEPNGSFTSKTLRRGGTYARRFPRPGTFAYLCAIHPQMRGRVIVR